MYRDMQRAPSQVGGTAYVKRYGGWLKALEAFVERVNADSGDAPSAAEATVLEPEAKPRTDCLDSFQSAEDRRDIRLGQRFRVLKRDNFKCVLCGNTPAIDPTCTLHVDHVLPFSRGGKTADTNLRSLCAACNVGRGDRYYDLYQRPY